MTNRFLTFINYPYNKIHKEHTMDPEDFADQTALNQEHDDEYDQFLHDGDADGDALASAGFGTDEDYGMYASDFDG